MVLKIEYELGWKVDPPFFTLACSCNGKIAFLDLQKTGTFLWPIPYIAPHAYPCVIEKLSVIQC